MAEFFALLFSLLFIGLVFLPILTFLRLGRISRELEGLTARVRDLESAHANLGAPTSAPVGATAGKPDAPSAPTSAPVGATAGKPGAPSAPSAPETLRDEPEDLEERIGGRGLLYTGVFVLLLGVSFFLKYAFDNAWINETARALIGLVTGVTLIIGGLRLVTSGLTTFGQALVGTGFAVLYLVVYAALNFYFLIDRGTAFALMVVTTLTAAIVADRQRSQPLAFIAVGGGFLTPALVGGDENAQLTLFTYDAILVFGTTLLAFRQQWPALNALSYLGTFLTVVAWAGRYYTDDQWLRTLLFLTLFCVAFLVIIRETRRSSRTLTARAVIALLWTAPVVYHVAAIVMTAAHPPAIHIYLIAFTAVGLWMSVEPHRPWLRLVLLLAAFVPMFGAITLPEGRSWLVANVITMIAVALLHIMAIVDRAKRQDESLSGGDLLTLHVTGLGLFSLLYSVLQPAFPGFRGALAALIAVGAVGLGRVLRTRDEIAWLNTIALAFTLVAVGIAVQFDGPPAIIGWAAEGLAATWLGARIRNRAFQFGGLILWILATLQLFDTYSQSPAAFTFLINARAFTTLFVLVAGYVMAWRLSGLVASEAPRMRAAIHIIASTLTVAWITAEIQAFWDMRSDSPQAHLYEQMVLSLAWSVYGAVLIVVGMRRQFALLRYIGMTIIGITVLKVFFYDLWELGGIYRVVGFLAFGVLLVLVSYLYQRRKRDQPRTPRANAGGNATEPAVQDANDDRPQF